MFVCLCVWHVFVTFCDIPCHTPISELEQEIDQRFFASGPIIFFEESKDLKVWNINKAMALNDNKVLQEFKNILMEDGGQDFK